MHKLIEKMVEDKIATMIKLNVSNNDSSDSLSRNRNNSDLVEVTPKFNK